MFQPLFVRVLTPEEREGLDQYSKSQNKEEGIRARVILASADGKTAVEISQSIGSHPANIKKWIRKFNADGLEGISAKNRGHKAGQGQSSQPFKLKRCWAWRIPSLRRRAMALGNGLLRS